MFDATIEGPYCPVQPTEMSIPNMKDESDEDCLRLNVFKSNADFTTKVPVMVYIHGGGFVLGSSVELFTGPDLIMKRDVLLVTMNYRLGLLGEMHCVNVSK